MNDSRTNQKTYFKVFVIVRIVALVLNVNVSDNPAFSKGMPNGKGVGKGAINPAEIITGLGNGLPKGMGVGKNAVNPAGILTGFGIGKPGGMAVGKNAINPAGIMTGMGMGQPGAMGVGKNAVNPAGIMTGLGAGKPGAMGVGNNAVNPAGIMTGLGNQNNFQGQGIINNTNPGQSPTVPNGLGANITNNNGSVFSENGFGVAFDDQDAFIGQQNSSIVVKVNPNSAWVMVKNKAKRNDKYVLASGDIFSQALGQSDLAATSLEVPDPIGAKGPNPTHGGTHAKKGDGNPGGGNGNGHWGQGNQGNGLGNIWTGNQGRGVGEGMAGGRRGQIDASGAIDPSNGSDPGGVIVLSSSSDPDGGSDPSGGSDTGGGIVPSGGSDPAGANDPSGGSEPAGGSDPAGEDGEPEDSTDISVPFVPLQIAMISGCPVELGAVALELGITKTTIQVSIENALALNPSILPCQACATLIDAAGILRDEDGSRMAAMNEIFNQLAPADAPFTPETAAAIAMAFADAAEDSQYDSVTEYIDAFVRYISVLDNELGSPVGDSVAFVMDKHGAGIMASDNPNIAAFVAMYLEGSVTFGELPN